MVSWSGTVPMFNGLMPGSPAIIANGGSCQAQDQRGAAIQVGEQVRYHRLR